MNHQINYFIIFFFFDGVEISIKASIEKHAQKKAVTTYIANEVSQ